MGWNSKTLGEKKSRNSGWRGHSTAQESQVSWLEVNLFAGVMRWYTSRIHISWLQKWSLGMAFPSFLRPQNLEKLSLEELHQRKHDLKQEDQLRRARRFFSMRYKMYEATRCIYTVVCCNHLTSSWDLGPSSSTLKLTYIHLSNLAHLTMPLRASVNISEEMTQCSRILAHFGTIVGSVACRKTIKTWWCPRRSVDRTVPVPWQKKNQQEWRFWYQNGEPVFFAFKKIGSRIQYNILPKH